MKLLLRLSLSLILVLLHSSCWAGVDFDGVDDTISIADSATLTLTDAGGWIIAILTNVTDNSGNLFQYVLSTNAFSANNSIQLYLNEDSEASAGQWTTRVIDSDGSFAGVGSGGTSSPGGDSVWRWIIWRHPAGSNDFILDFGLPGQTIVNQGSDTNATVGDVDGDIWYVGRRHTTPTSRWYKGLVAEVVIITGDGSLATAQRIVSSQIRYMPIQGGNTKLYLPLDDQPDGTSFDGDTAIDRSGNGNDGTGDDGGNNTGLTAKAEEVLSYQPIAMFPTRDAAAVAAAIKRNRTFFNSLDPTGRF